MFSRHPSQRGGVLLVALVLLIVIIVFLSAVGGLIVTQRHALAQSFRAAQAFHLADAGFEYFVSLTGKSTCIPKRLDQQTIRRPMRDSATQETVGTYTLTFSLMNDTLLVTSIGTPVGSDQCQGVTGTLIPEKEKRKYLITWRPLGSVACPSATDIIESPC